MPARRVTGAGLCACGALVIFSWPAAAQESAEPIEEIQVTATRRPAAIGEVSAALTVVSTDDVARAKLATDALAAKPGVFLQQTTPGQGAAIIRGLKGSEVLHLVDGMRLNNAIFRNAPTQYLALVAPGTLDRIEVLRGAPASLYGSDAVGGVVQALSRIPSFETSGYRADAYVGADTADLTRNIRGSLEFGNADYAALVGGEYLQTGNRRTGGGERVGPSGYEASGGRIAVSLTPAETERWLIDLQFARQPSTPRIDELVAGFGETEPASSEFFFEPNDRVFAHVRHSRDDWLLGASWSFDLGWQRIVDDRRSRNFGSDIRRYEENSSDLLGLTVNVSAETGSGSWVAGFEIYHDEVASTRVEEDLVTGTLASVTPRFPDGATMDQAAVYGSYTRRFGERHALTGGLRFSAIGTDLPGGGLEPPASADQDDVSADLGWVFDIAEATQLTANLGYGFRAPNVFDLGTLGERPGNRFNIPNPELDSEHITQFDVGVRHRGEFWDLDVVLFVLSYEDRIASVLTGDVTADGRDVTQSRNVESADIHGLEIGGHLVVSPSLTADVVLNYVRGEQSEADGTTVPGDRIPPFNGRLGMRWARTDTMSVEPYLVFAAGQDRLSPRDALDTRIDPNGTPGWLTANVRADWDIGDRWRLSAAIENLFDKRYRVHGSGIDAVGMNLLFAVHSRWE